MKYFKNITRDRAVLFAAILIIAGLFSFGTVHTVSARNIRNQLSKTRCQSFCIGLYEDRASPDTIAVPLGNYVQFNSKDGKTHDLSFGEGGVEHVHSGKFYSGDFSANEGWRVQFNQEGTFYFHDHLNPKISILIIVYSPGKNYKIQ